LCSASSSIDQSTSGLGRKARLLSNNFALLMLLNYCVLGQVF
jgi:hypothetical protein